MLDPYFDHEGYKNQVCYSWLLFSIFDAKQIAIKKHTGQTHHLLPTHFKCRHTRLSDTHLQLL